MPSAVGGPKPLAGPWWAWGDFGIPLTLSLFSYCRRKCERNRTQIVDFPWASCSFFDCSCPAAFAACRDDVDGVESMYFIVPKNSCLKFRFELPCTYADEAEIHGKWPCLHLVEGDYSQLGHFQLSVNIQDSVLAVVDVIMWSRTVHMIRALIMWSLRSREPATLHREWFLFQKKNCRWQTS